MDLLSWLNFSLKYFQFIYEIKGLLPVAFNTNLTQTIHTPDLIIVTTREGFPP